MQEMWLKLLCGNISNEKYSSYFPVPARYLIQYLAKSGSNRVKK